MQFVVWTFWFGFCALFLLVGLQLLNGRINTKGLLYRRDLHNELEYSPDRTQMLVSTFAFAAEYLGKVYQDPSQLPDIPQQWLYILGGSHSVYLAGKALRLRKKLKTKKD